MSTTRRGLFQRVLVATDFTPGSGVAVSRAARLPLGARATLTLAHVLPRSGAPSMDAHAASVAAAALETAAARAARILARRGLDNVTIHTVLARGSAGTELAKRAKRTRAELLVIGRHGRRGITSLFLGSTASRVLHNSRVPVLIVQRRSAKAYAQPAVAVQLDGSSREAAVGLLRVVHAPRPPISLVHATPIPFDFPMRMVGATSGEVVRYRARAMREARLALRELISSIRSGNVTWKINVEFGEPRDILVRLVCGTRIDLLAMGTHGRAGIRRTILGSVAESVLGAVPCDVLIVRPRIRGT